MSVDPTPVFEDFIAKVKAIVAPIQVFEGEVPEDSALPVQNGKLLPYIVVYTGGPIRSGRDHHIVNSRHDTTILFFTVQAHAPRADVARHYKGKIAELAGEKLVNSGELLLSGGTIYSRASNEVRPTTYIDEVAFTTRSNLAWT